MTLPHNEELLIKRENTYCSPETTDAYPIVVGISISSNFVDFSFAYRHDPFNIFDLNTSSTSEEYEATFSTKGKYVKNDSSFLFGEQASRELPESAEDINVYDVIFDHLFGQNKLPEEPPKLDATNVVSEFLKRVFKLASEKIKKIAEEEEANFLSSHKKQFATHLDNDRKEEIKKKFAFNTDHCRYCVAGPGKQGYQDFIRKAFLSAEIIKENNPHDRLMFVNSAEALGYHSIADRGYEGQYKYRSKYLLCDVNYHYVDFAEIYIDATQSSSSVSGYDTANVPIIQGWSPLKDLYKKYLSKNNPNEIDVNEEIEKLHQEMKNPNFLFDDCKKKELLEPFVKSIKETALHTCKADSGLKGVYFSGNLTTQADFNEELFHLANTINIDIDVEVSHSVNNTVLSSGAVTRALRVPLAKFPTVKDLTTKDESVTPKGSTTKDDRNRIIKDKAVSSKDYDYVIGMDFGTTYSGCSYALTKEAEKPKEEKKVFTPIIEWTDTPHYKAPTLLSYNALEKKLGKYWGGSVLTEECARIERFKLLMSEKTIRKFYEDKAKTLEKTIKGSTYNHISPETMIATYIKRLKEGAIKQLRKEERKKKRKVPKDPKIKYVLTVPCMWTDTAKTTMKKAAVSAEFASHQDEITVITEPEAAALRFHISATNLDILGTRFIVCDAGGGTVDLVTYSAERLASGELSIQQVGDGCGDLCGSDQINKKFREYLGGKCFTSRFRNLDKLMRELDNNFEQEKRDFEGKQDIKISFARVERDLPDDFRNSCAREMCRIENGHFVIPLSEAKKLFDPFVDRTTELLEEEYSRTKFTDNKVTGLILVGGFARSLYLQEKVKAWCSPYGIYCPDRSINLDTCVSDGAVLYALDPQLVTKRNAVHSYGLLRLEPDSGNDTIDLFVHKDQEISSSGEPFEKKITLNESGSTIIAIYSTSEKYVSYMFDSSKYSKVLEVRIDSRYVDGSDRTATVGLQFGPTDIYCYVTYGKRKDFLYGSKSESGHIGHTLRHLGMPNDLNAIEFMVKSGGMEAPPIKRN